MPPHLPLGRRLTLGSVLVLIGALLAPVREAAAGCGCAKPAPPPAAVRPGVTYAGTPVQLFASFTVGQSYTVTFTSGITGASATATATAVRRRDLSDGVYKSQLNVRVPALPLGPTRISVTGTTAGGVILSIPDTDFTVAPQPIALPLIYGNYVYPNFQAAVGRNGLTYISLDLTGMTQPLIFEADLQGYPLRFTNQDVIFRNIQGFLMQTLVQSSPSGTLPIPGMFVWPSATPSTTSDRLHYSRHEFNTYFLQHRERQPHSLDPTDPYWHIDGTPHIDHDHLIVALSARQNDGTLPSPGATPVCTIRLTAYSLFFQGLVGDTGISMTNSATADSFDRTTGVIGQHGDVATNGSLTMTGSAQIAGDATAASFKLGTGSVTGVRTTLGTPMTFMPIKVPAGLPTLPDVSLSGGAQTIVGPGSFQVNNISLSNSSSRLYIDNSAGPVTLYVLGELKMSAGSIVTADPNPEKFAVYVVSSKTVALKGGATTFYGVVYAPLAPISLSGEGQLTGAFVGGSLIMSGTTRVRYDSSLRGKY